MVGDLPTVTLVVTLRGPGSGRMRVDIRLDRHEVDGGIVVPRTFGGETRDGIGRFEVWPNSRGSRSSRYRVSVCPIGSDKPEFQGTFVAPETDGEIRLEDHLEDRPFPPKDGYQVALANAASSAASAAAQTAADDAAEQAVADVVGKVTGFAEAAEESAGAAEGSAGAAASSASAASRSSTSAREDAAQAGQSAQRASNSSESAGQSAGQAAQARDEAQAARKAAGQSVGESAAAASRAASNASQSSGDAETASRARSNAQAQANSAASSAEEASESATRADRSADRAETRAEAAADSARSAESERKASAASAAESSGSQSAAQKAAQSADQSRIEASQSATGASQSANAASRSATDAEAAARSIDYDQESAASNAQTAQDGADRAEAAAVEASGYYESVDARATEAEAAAGEASGYYASVDARATEAEEASTAASQARASADSARDAAENSADRSRDEADRAQLARDAARQAGNVYPDVDSGVAALSEGDYFNVLTPDLVVGYRPYRIVDGAAVEQPNNKTLRLNDSADIAQTVDQGGAPVERIDRDGRAVVPGAPAGLQDAFAGQSLSKYHALLHWQDTYGRDVPQRDLLYNLWRAQHEAGAPIKRNVQIVAPDDSGAKLQRLPCCAEVRPGVVLVTNSQVGPNGPNSDTDGLRLVGRFVYIDLSTGRVNAIGPAIVIDEPDGYDEGTGSSAPESVFVRDNGDAVVIFKYISDTLGNEGVDRDVCQRTVSPDGTVGARTRIINGADWDNLLGTANGTAVALRGGPFAGRWVFPIYFYPTPDGRRLNTMYSDDQGESWSFGEPITDSAGFNEWAFAQQPDGSLVGSARTREQRHPRLYCPPEGGGASGWGATDLDYFVWFDHQNNRSVEQLSLDPSNGVPGVVWSSTIPINSTNYANNATEYGRRNLGLRISFDGLVTPSHEYTFDIVDSPAGYSDIMRLSNGMYLNVFETGFNSPPVHIRAYIFNLSEVIQHGYPV